MNWNYFKKPTALALAVEQLEQTRRERLAAEAALEYYVAMTRTLQDREKRLEKEINRLTSLQSAAEGVPK